MSEPQIDPNAVVSHEQDGRVLSGVGVSADQLAETMDRHTPEPASAAEGTSTAPVDGNATESAPAVPESRGRKRFADLTREREQARQDAATAKAERDAIARERDELKARVQQPAAQTPPASQTQPAAPSSPAKFAFPGYEAWVEQGNPQGSYDDWQDAKLFAFGEWKDQQSNIEARIRQSIEADRASRSFADTVQSVHTKARAAYSDFDAMMSTGPGAAVPLGPSPDEAIARARFIITHPQSEHLYYAILKDGDLARRLQQMDPIAFGVAIAQMAPNGSGASPASPAVSARVTPPAPMQPVGTGTRTTVTPSAELVKGGFDFDKSGYRERRAAERGIRRR